MHVCAYMLLASMCIHYCLWASMSNCVWLTAPVNVCELQWVCVCEHLCASVSFCVFCGHVCLCASVHEYLEASEHIYETLPVNTCMCWCGFVYHCVSVQPQESVFICEHLYASLWVCKYLCLSVSICEHECDCVQLQTSVCLWASVCLYMCMCKSVYLVYLCMFSVCISWTSEFL